MRRWRRRAWLSFVLACLPAAFAFDVLMLAARSLQLPRPASRAAAGLCVVLACAVAGEGFLGMLAELGSDFPIDTAVSPTAARGHAGPRGGGGYTDRGSAAHCQRDRVPVQA